MPITRAEARQLSTKPEFDLYVASTPTEVKSHTATRLKSKIDRSRKLRDKYRDLAKRQRLEARGKKAPSGTRAAQGNQRTVRKAELFAEVLERFEKRLEVVERVAAREAAAKEKKRLAAEKKKAASAKKTTARKAPAKKASARKAPAKKAAVKGTTRATKAAQKSVAARAGGRSKASQAQTTTRARAVSAHVKSRGKRTQARRDRRS